MAGSISCTVVSPERPLFEGEAEHVVVPGADGELGIYPMHAALVARLGVGVVRLHKSLHEIESFATRGGFVRVGDDELTLLVTEAVRAEDVDEPAIRSELEEVIMLLQHPSSPEQYAELRTRRRWLETCLKLHA